MSKIKVLFVDDNQLLLETLCELLSLSGYDTLCAVSAEDGFKAVEEYRPDVVLSDVQMPGEDGYYLLNRLKEHFDKKSMPKFLFVSAFAQKEDIEKGLNAGADGYLTKPFEVKVMVSEIEKALTNRP